MSDFKGLQMGALRATVSTGAVGAGSAIILAGDMDTEFDAPFLIKSVDTHWAWLSITASDTVILGIAQGDMSAAEIAAALLQAITDPFDVAEKGALTTARGIFWETLQIFSSTERSATKRISIGGGKGIPIAEVKGFNHFLFNQGGGTLTDANLAMMTVIKGVWLSD